MSNRLYKNKEQFPSPWLYFRGTVLWLFNFLWRWNDLFAISAFLELIYLFWANAFTPHMYSLHKNFRIFELYIVFCYQIVFLSFLCQKKLLTYLLAYSLFPFCSSSSICCWLCKFCSLISKIWFWTMVLSDCSSSIPLLTFLSSFVNCNLICFFNFWKTFPHICFIFCPRYETDHRYNFWAHQFFERCLTWKRKRLSCPFSYGCHIY